MTVDRTARREMEPRDAQGPTERVQFSGTSLDFLTDCPATSSARQSCFRTLRGRRETGPVTRRSRTTATGLHRPGTLAPVPLGERRDLDRVSLAGQGIESELSAPTNTRGSFAVFLGQEPEFRGGDRSG